jgi:HEAT repeat protein
VHHSLRLLGSCGLMAVIALAGPARADEDPVIGGKKVTEWFRFLREEKDARKRQAALLIIDIQAGPKVAVVFPGLLRELREHPDAATRARIAELLLKYKDKGDDLIKALVAALKTDKDAKVRAMAAATLGKLERIASSAVSDLGDALKDPAGSVRAAAAEAIGQFSAFDAEIARDWVPALAACLKDAEVEVRMSSTYALARMGPTAAPAVPALGAAAAGDKEAAVRKEAAKALAAIGPKAGDAASALIKALQDSNADVRLQAAYALGRIGPDAAAALPDLIKAVKDKDKSVRCHAIHAIGAMGKAATPAIPDLIGAVKDDVVADVRLAAIEELAAFGPDAKAAQDVLMVASRDGKPAIREAAQDALKKIQQSP